MAGFVSLALVVNGVVLWIYNQQVSHALFWDELFPWVSLSFGLTVVLALATVGNAPNDAPPKERWALRCMMVVVLVAMVACAGFFWLRGILAVGFVESPNDFAAFKSLKHHPFTAEPIGERYADELVAALALPEREDRECRTLEWVYRLHSATLGVDNGAPQVLVETALNGTCERSPQRCDLLRCTAGPMPWKRGEIESPMGILSGGGCDVDVMARILGRRGTRDCFVEEPNGRFYGSVTDISKDLAFSHLTVAQRLAVERALVEKWCEVRGGAPCVEQKLGPPPKTDAP